jgi:hypothetical protein
MKKLLLMLATAGLLAATGTAQAGGTLLADGGGGACSATNKGNLCTETTVQICTDWKLVKTSVNLTLEFIPTGFTYQYDCSHWETTTSRTYYPA